MEKAKSMFKAAGKKIKSAMRSAGTEAQYAMATIGLAPVMGMRVLADENMVESVKGVVEVMLNVFKYVGVVLLIWGVGQLVMAFRNEDADSKTRAIMVLVAAAALLSLQALLGQIPGVREYLP